MRGVHDIRRVKTVLEALLFPPGLVALITATGLLLLRTRRRAGMWLLGAAIGLLYVLSLPVTASAIMHLLQIYPALSPSDTARKDAQAIVVLAAGRTRSAPEYGGDTISPLALERLRYGVHVQRQTGLPLILSGGSPQEFPIAEAELLKEAAVLDFAVPVLLTEEKSNTTWENAKYTTALLRERGITRVYLVTHAWHMPRAVWSFERAGMNVLPAPTSFVIVDASRITAWLPSAAALVNVRYALHEMTGLLWYRLRVIPIS